MSLTKRLRSGLRIQAERAARRFGIALFPHWRAHAWVEQQHMRRLLDHLQPDCVFDLGANRGQFARALRHEMGFRGLIVSYEPIPDLAAGLAQAAAGDPNWVIVPKAVGRQAGTATFNIMASDQFSSLRAPDVSVVGDIDGQNRIARAVPVEIVTLAGELARLQQAHGFRRPFLKMDTQGFDVEAVAGAGPAIGTFVGLKSELSIQPLYQGAPDFMQALAAYRAAGFELSAFVPNNAGHFPRLIEIDCHMVRRDLMPGAQPAQPEPAELAAAQ
jgi:FkbM family methyltransferase